MAGARMTFDNTVRLLLNIDRLARPGESLAEAAERAAIALERAGFRGYIMTAAQGDMDPIIEGCRFGPDEEGALPRKEESS